jgi:hypothetical protein
MELLLQRMEPGNLTGFKFTLLCCSGAQFEFGRIEAEREDEDNRWTPQLKSDVFCQRWIVRYSSARGPWLNYENCDVYQLVFELGISHTPGSILGPLIISFFRKCLSPVRDSPSMDLSLRRLL